MELLVVIAVLAILGAVGFVSMRAALRAVDRVACASNLRNIGIAVQAFTVENDGYFPLTTHNTKATDSTWLYTLKPYLEDVHEVMVCPADPRSEELMERELSSYVLNEYVAVANRDQLGVLRPDSYHRIDLIPNPSSTVVAFIGSDRRPLAETADHTHSRSWLTWSAALLDIQPNRFSDGGSATMDGLGGSANYLYADAHVRNVSAETFKAYFDEGRNPSDPGQF